MRRAVEADWPALWDMCKQFAKTAELPYSLDESTLKGVILDLMKHGYVAVSEGGFICGIIAPSPLNKSWIVAKEFLWWSTDGSGAALMHGFRRWAKSNGASEIQMSCPDNARVQKFYSRFGSLSEVVYSEIDRCA